MYKKLLRAVFSYFHFFSYISIHENFFFLLEHYFYLVFFVYLFYFLIVISKYLYAFVVKCTVFWFNTDILNVTKSYIFKFFLLKILLTNTLRLQTL